MSATREVYEQRLASAISRYVGYTTGAYDLDRIISVATLLSTKPFRFDVEIVHQLRKEYNIREDYARGIIDFATGLGLIHRIPGEGAYSRLTISDLGRSLEAASYTSNRILHDFTLCFTLLESDADIYGLVLDFIERRGSVDWVGDFGEAVATLRRERYEWLQEVFSTPELVRRVAEHVRWLEVKPREIKIAEVGLDFVRHHTTPRRGWAQRLGHITETGQLSGQGKELVARLRAGREHYFWIGPDEETLRALKIETMEIPQPIGPAWSLLRPISGPTTPPERVIDEVGRYMVEVYPIIRMHRTNQAPLPAITPFLYLQENMVGDRMDHDEIFIAVFAKFSDVLAPLSGRGRKFGHYQLRVGT